MSDTEAPARATTPDVEKVKIKVPDFPAMHMHPVSKTFYKVEDGDEGFIRVWPWDVLYFLRRRDEGFDLYEEPEAKPEEVAEEEEAAAVAEAAPESPARRRSGK